MGISIGSLGGTRAGSGPRGRTLALVLAEGAIPSWLTLAVVRSLFAPVRTQLCDLRDTPGSVRPTTRKPRCLSSGSLEQLLLRQETARRLQVPVLLQLEYRRAGSPIQPVGRNL